MIDFERSGYFEKMLERPPEHLHTEKALQDAWEGVCGDEPLAARWSALGSCPEGSLGLGVWRFYRARGFSFPGSPGSAPPTLAQHDWIHVLADFGSTVECEIEVFGFISRANDDPAGFSLLAMVLGLFETGYLFNAAKGFFEYDRGHLSRDADRMALRLADAMARGANAAWYLDDHDRGNDTDFLGVDWFQYADWPLDDVRRHFGVPDKSAKAVAAGSVTPWEPGGISPFQYAHGREVLEAEGAEYDSFGAVTSSEVLPRPNGGPWTSGRPRAAPEVLPRPNGGPWKSGRPRAAPSLSAMNDTVRYERDGHVATITYNRPDVAQRDQRRAAPGAQRRLEPVPRGRGRVGRHRHRCRQGVLRRRGPARRPRRRG